MVNKIMNLTENDPMHNELVNEVNNATDDELVIVARSYKNRKDNRVKPIAVKNGIYFYVAYDLDGKTAFFGNVTPEQIYKAKANMMRRVRLGSMMSLLFSEGETLENFKFSGDPMNVATLDCKMYGAGLLYCEEFLKAMEQKIGRYYILPSSIHELIFVPADVMLKSDLTDMVREINVSEVSEGDYLADNVFEMDEWI